MYPLRSKTWNLPGRDINYLDLRLKNDSARLFETTEVKFDVLSVDENLQTFELQTRPVLLTTQCIREARELQMYLEKLQDQVPAQCTIYIIPQRYSWGVLCVPETHLRKILYTCEVFTPFLEVVHRFGSKVGEDFPLKPTNFRYIETHLSKSQGPFHYEICYTLEFMEENGRNHGNGWSSRKTGIYQQVSHTQYNAVWILLQPSDALRECLESVLSSLDLVHEDRDSNPMYLHATFLLATLDNWGRYIEHLNAELKEIDRKACFARITAEDRKFKGDFDVSIQDTQILQRLRQKITSALLALQSCLDVARQLDQHCKELDILGAVGSLSKILGTIHGYEANIKAYHKSTLAMDQTLQGVLTLVYGILEFRQEQVHQKVAETTLHSVKLLRDIMIRIQLQNGEALLTAQQSQRESVTVKTLTYIAVVFLPGSFIATIFSSNLIQLQPNANSNGTKNFEISPQFWVFVVTTVLLTAATLGAVRWIERHRKVCPRQTLANHP